jgi:GGDEF domain-containing protein
MATLDELAQQLADEQRQRADEAAGAKAPDLGALADSMVQERAARRQADVDLLRFRDQHFPVEPARAADALRIAAATGQQPEYVLKNFDALAPKVKPFLAAEVDWDKVAREHPDVFGAVLDPVKGPVIRDAVGELQGVSWALTGRWENQDVVVSPEDAARNRAALENVWGEPDLSGAPTEAGPATVRRQVAPSAVGRAAERGVQQQEYVRRTFEAATGQAQPGNEQRLQDLEELATADVGADSALARGVLAPVEMAPYLAGRILAGQAGRLVTAGIGAAVGALAGTFVEPLGGTALGAAEGAAFGYGVAGPAADYVAGVGWDTYQTVGPLYRQLTQLRDENGAQLLTDEEARRWAFGGSALTSALTAGLGAKFVRGVEGALVRQTETALGKALAQRTVVQAMKDLAREGGSHLASGALMLAVQNAGMAVTTEAAAANSSSHEFSWSRVGRSALEGLEAGVRDLWLLSFWGPGRKFIGDVGLAVESRRAAHQVERFVDALDAAQRKVPESGHTVLDQVVSRLAQAKGGDRPLRELYFRKEAWDAFAQKLGVDPGQLAGEVLGDGGKGYGEVQLHGGDVVVPVARARRLLRGDKAALDFVKQEGRAAPELKSAREVVQDQVDQLNRMRAAAETPDAVKQRQAIFEAIRGRALAAKENPQRAADLARQFADAAAAVGARLGVPPAEAAAMMGIGRLRIVGGPSEKVARLRQERAAAAAMPDILGLLSAESQERIRVALGSIDRSSAQGQAIAELAAGAYRHPVTGLPNRLAFEESARAARPGQVFISADMAGLKAINDAFGHEAGDRALRTFSEAWAQALREVGGQPAHTGGDEFMAVVPRAAARQAVDRAIAILQAKEPLLTRADLAQLKGELRAQAEAWWPAGGDFKVSARFGIGPTPKTADAAELVARQAQIAKHGDIRAGKSTQGHGESFVHDAFDPASPVRAAAEAASARRLADWQATHPGQEALAEVEPGAVVGTRAALGQGEHGSLEVVLDDGTGKPLEAVLHLTDPNALTGSHEFAHWLVESLSRMATRGELDKAGETGVPSLREDYDALLRWAGWESHAARQAETAERVALAGKKGRTAAEGRRLQELTAKEERVSYAWEQLLGEGRAPSASLAGPFRRFSRWVARIYGGIEGVEAKYRDLYGQDLGMNEEVRGIFRRLVASQEEIAKAKAGEEHLPFRPPEQLTPEERARWAELDAKDRAAAEAALLHALTLETRKDQREVVTKLKTAIREKVDQELDGNLVYQAQRFLAEGVLRAGEAPPPDLIGPDGQVARLDRGELVRRYGADLVKQLPQAGLAERGGVKADDLAAALGFPSGDAMVRALAAAEPRERVAQREAARRVLDQLGPVLLEDPARLNEAALDASYTPEAAEKVLLSIRSIARDIDPTLPARLPAIDLELLRAQAERLIGEKPVGELSPAYYREAAKAAARRAFKLAAEAAEGKDAAKRQAALVKAYDETQAQNLSEMLYRAAKEAQERADAARVAVEKTAGEAWRAELGLASPIYREVHDELLAAVGIGPAIDPAVARASFDQLLGQAAADAAVMDEGWQPVVRDLLRRPREWAQLTVDEVQALRDAVTNIRRAANLKNEVKLLDKMTSRGDLLDEMEATARAANPVRARGRRDAATEGDTTTVRSGVRGLAASLLGIETIATYLDGENRDGPFHRLFVDALVAARNREADLAKRYGQVLKDAWAEMPQEVKDRRFELVDLRQDLPLRGELADSAWVDDSAVQRTYLWMVFLNRGNAENLQRLTDGYGWSVEQVDAALERHLTPAEGRFLQKVLDSLEGLYPEIAALHERDTGLKPGKVKAEAFELTLGGERQRFAGGYFPAKYDPRPGMSRRGFAAQEREVSAILNPESLYPGTPKGHTKARAVQVHDVLNLQWDVVPRHVSSVIHDLAFREYVREAAYIVTTDRFRTIVASTLGLEYFDQFKPWLQSVATGRDAAVTSEIRQAFGLIMLGRSRAMVGALGHRMSVALGDLMNPVLATLQLQVRPDHLARAAAELTPGAPGWRERWAFAHETSKELSHRRERATHQLRQELASIGEGNALMRSPKTRALGELVKGAQESAFVLMEHTDRIASTHMWLAKYLDEKAAGEKAGRPDAHTRAVRAADDLVRRSQPAEWAGEKSAILRRRDVFGTILMFYGWLNQVHQAKRLAVHRAVARWQMPGATAGDRVGAVARAAGILLGTTIGVALGDAASGHGKLADDESWADWWKRKLVAGEFVDLPFVGPWVEHMYATQVEGKQARFPVRTAPGLAFGENILRELGKVADGETAPDERGWAAVKASGLLSGLPVSQLVTSGQYVTSGRAGEDAAAGRPLDVLGGLIYGERDGGPQNPLTGAQELISGGGR